MAELIPILGGFILGVATTFGLLAWLGKQAEVKPVPQSRELAIAEVLLHRARRDRQLAELERHLRDRSNERLRRLTDEY